MRAVKDSAIYLIGELISRAIPFLLLPYLSRKLGAEGFGELSYIQTFLVLFFIIVSLSQEGAVTRYFYVYGKRSLNLVVFTGYAYSLLIGSLILIGCWIMQSEILAYTALSAIFQSFLGVQLSLRQCQKQPIPYTIIQFLSSLSSVLLTIGLFSYFNTDLVEKRILAILFSNVFVFLIALIIYNRKQPIKCYNFRQYKSAFSYLFGFGIPLILHNASLFLRGQLDRVFIFHQFNQVDLGLYAMGAQIASILMVLLQAINKASIPYFFDGLKQKRISVQHIYKWTMYSLFIVPLPAIIMAIIPETVVVWLLGEQFVGTKYYIVCFLFSTALTIPYFILTNYLFYYGKNSFISLSSLCSTLIYLFSLIGLTLTKIEYVPFASIIGAIAILPMLFLMTKKTSRTL